MEKAKELRGHTAGDLTEKQKGLREELFNLRFRNSLKQLDNPMRIRAARRELAIIQTLLSEDKKGVRKLGASSQS